MTATVSYPHNSPSAPGDARRRIRPAARAAFSVSLLMGLVLALLAGLDTAQAQPSAHRSTTTQSQPSASKCSVSAELVPRCGRWWGVAPLAHTTTPLQTALPREEKFAGRKLDIVHVYHTNSQLFPTPAERAVALQRGHNRLLLINWKPATDMSWAKVAQGKADARIDREAAYLRKNFRHHFFLDVFHEPENDVRETRGSGYTASDYAAMYRHVITRLRHDGVTWTVNVMNYMGFVNWGLKSWFSQLWPGSSYADWVAIDPYGTGAAHSSYTPRTFADLVNGRYGTKFPGFYNYIKAKFPGKPIMLAEWGVAAVSSNPSGQAYFFRTVESQLAHYPLIKACVYFDMPTPPKGQPRTYLGAYTSTYQSYTRLSKIKAVVAPRISYGG